MLSKAIVTTVLLAVTAAPSIASDETKKTDTPLQTAIAREAKSSDNTLATWAVIDAQKRPVTLTTLYGSYAALQVLDVVSTKRALDAGAREVNPVMRGNNMATIGVKAAAGGAT